MLVEFCWFGGKGVRNDLRGIADFEVSGVTGGSPAVPGGMLVTCFAVTPACRPRTGSFARVALSAPATRLAACACRQVFCLLYEVDKI